MIQIAVCGGRECDEKIYALAEEAGKCLAAAGVAVICGGLGGVMEATAKGARSAGGLTIGVVPGRDMRTANAYIDVVVASGVGFARNLGIASSCHGMLAIDGGFGSLTEIAYALDGGKPVAMINTWKLTHPHLKNLFVREFTDPRAAVIWLLTQIRQPPPLIGSDNEYR